MARNMNAHFQDLEFRLNRGDIHYRPLNLGSEIVRRTHKQFKGVYDFSVQGGSTSAAINLYDPVFGKNSSLILPAGFIISKVLIDVLTNPVGAGATIALSSGKNAADLLAATAIASFTGLIDGIPTTAAATNIKISPTLAAPGSICTLTIATTNLSAGKFNVFITGYFSDAQ